MDLQEAIPKSIATVMKGTYVYVKTDIMEKPDIHFMVSKDKDEITVITKKENIKNLKVLELVGDYKLIEFKPAVPFQTVGFLAKIAEIIVSLQVRKIIRPFSKNRCLRDLRRVSKKLYQQHQSLRLLSRLL